MPLAVKEPRQTFPEDQRSVLILTQREASCAARSAWERERNSFPSSKLCGWGRRFAAPRLGRIPLRWGPRSADPSHTREVIAAPFLGAAPAVPPEWGCGPLDVPLGRSPEWRRRRCGNRGRGAGGLGRSTGSLKRPSTSLGRWTDHFGRMREGLRRLPEGFGQLPGSFGQLS